MNSGEYKKYIWQSDEWPHWSFDYETLASVLSKVNTERGRLLGAMQGLGFEASERATLDNLTSDVIKSSEIEGEKLNPEAVRSSLARRLGLEVAGQVLDTRHVDGIVEMVLDATKNHQKPLTHERMFGWHAALFPTGYTGMSKIKVGEYRDDANGPMQVVSGGFGREKVHYQAPPADALSKGMDEFIEWFNATDNLDPILKAGIAHLWFVTLHPFEDGNGRIGRAVCDMALAKADGIGQRFYSLSGQIQRERNNYYDHLEQAQKATMDVTEWLTWFLECLLRAIEGSHSILSSTMHRANFWKHWEGVAFNERQAFMLKRFLDNFEGNLTNKKWAIMTKTSPDTALRDLKDLVAKGVLYEADSGGRSTHYLLSE